MIKDACELRECPECASSNIVCEREQDQVICRDCGLVFEPLTKVDEEQFERAAGLPEAQEKKKAPAKKRKK